jgi:membrane-associated phospholipid phosphatase
MIKEIKRILTSLDNFVFDHMHPYVNEMNTNIMVIISFLASHTFLLPANILLATYLLFVRKNKWAGIKVIVVSLGSVLLMYGLKYYFRRVRPVHPVHEAASGYSFPSGHSMSAMTFYGLIIYLFISRIKDVRARWLAIIFLSLLILAIGFSRIYLRVHYTSDVFGGFLFGYLWLAASLWILNWIEKKSIHEKNR